MGMRAVQFAPDEWYHCFTRGVDKRQIYMNERDADRFAMLLYTCNATKPIHISNLTSLPRQGPALPYVLNLERGTPLVDIGAYCLMPNHPHLLIRERDYGGVTTFMQKLLTAYTMYFNKKYERTGALFSGRFKAVHVESDPHFRRVVNYVHANPAELYEPKWKQGLVRNEERLKRNMLSFPHSSLPDYEGIERPHNRIVNIAAVMEHLYKKPSFKTLLEDARVFYHQERDTLKELEP